jgi:hypothetical protein
VDPSAVRHLHSFEPRSPASARILDLAERVLDLHVRRSEHEGAARDAGLALRQARAERDAIEVDAALGEAEAPAAARKAAAARVEKAEATLEAAGERRRILAEAERRAEADLLGHVQGCDAELTAEHNADVEEACARLQERIGAALAEFEGLRQLVARGNVLLLTTGRSLGDQAQTYYVEQLERQLEAAGAAVAADRLAPVLPMPRGEEQVEESPAMLPEVRA